MGFGGREWSVCVWGEEKGRLLSGGWRENIQAMM